MRRVTITGFKSFAGKTVLELEPGTTAVVGPNGSGKSNLADAVRWALGEQGKSRLRLGDREEVVFAGNEYRPRASFAEVTLLFDNEDGAFPLDLTEVELSRRMYRSGETDYRLAGKSVRLSDIQVLLAEAGVGANTYAVIGQGMIDSMLTSSPAERKLLFDEAAGIRSSELGREAALRKLAATEANLVRLRDIAAEIEPRLTALNAAVQAQKEHQRLEQRVASLRSDVVSARHRHWNQVRDEAARSKDEASRARQQYQQELSELTRLKHRQQEAEEALARQHRSLAQELAALEQARDQIITELSTSRTSLAQARMRVQAAKDLSGRLKEAAREAAAAEQRLSELESELASHAEAAARAVKAVDHAAKEVAKAQAALVAIRDGASEGARDQYLDHALALLKTLAVDLDKPELTIGQIRLMIHKAGRLLSHATRSGAADLLADLKRAQKQLEAAMAKRETATEHQTNISITGRSREIDHHHQKQEVARLRDREAQLKRELNSLEGAVRELAKLEATETETEKKLHAASAQLEAKRQQLAALGLAPQAIEAATDLATRFERATTLLAQSERDTSLARERLQEAEAGLAEAQLQAREWGLAPVSSSSHHSLHTLIEQLTRAEAQLEARTEARQEQLSEYRQTSERALELRTQISDLETAQADLTALVGELDNLIRARFKENFQALAEQFSHYFKVLFEGGKASLELSEAEDGTYGIAIKASPAGKRLTSITALSGGERALAGVALVAAIMRVNPSPFVVLDEVDAALDEANSGRLANILNELEQYSQLIVITHNRQTMESARVLFGVTVNEQRTSRLISMRLEQATKLAAR